MAMATSTRPQHKATTSNHDFYHFPHGSQEIYLVGETKAFRKLVREVPIDNNTDVIDVGSSYGDCLNTLAKRTGGRAYGFEISQECVDACPKRFPRLRAKGDNVSCIHLCDVLSDSGANLVQQFASNSGVAFVDIGGDRHVEAVLRLWRESLFAPKVIVIKCRLLFRAARDHLGNLKQELDNDDATQLNGHLSNWWETSIEKIELNGLESGAAGMGAPRWYWNQPHNRAGRIGKEA